MSEAKYLVFDVESSGTDVFNDRIVQLFIATADSEGNLLETWEWIIDPGIKVPEEASNVHGFTTEYLRENGQSPLGALTSALDVFEAHSDLTWVAYNLNFDFSMLYAEFVRHGVTSGWAEGVIERRKVQLFDPLVVDRAKDKYRKGKRKLENVAGHYGVGFDAESAHKADYDVEVTAKVAVGVAKRYGIPSNTEQAEMYRTWAEGLQEYLRRSDPDAVVDAHWPLKLREDA